MLRSEASLATCYCERMQIERCRIVSAVVLAAFGTMTACSKPAPRIDCFDVATTKNSPGTRAVFAARHCQGGGVTWGPLLRVLARRQGPFAPVLEPTPGWTGAVYTMIGGANFSIDEEGDAARVCADDARLLDSLRDAYDALNGDAAALQRAMTEAPADEMECSEADGSAPQLPPMYPIATPPT
jgi:hypothetical protein